MRRLIGRYNSEVERFDAKFAGKARKAREDAINDFIEADSTEMSWTRALKQDLVRSTHHVFEQKELRRSLYRPFTKLWLYSDRELNEAVSLMPQLFPSPDPQNLAIGVTASMSRNEYSVLMVDGPASFHSVDMVGTQFFPLYFFDTEEVSSKEADRQRSIGFDSPRQPSSPTKHDALTNEGLAHFQAAYPGEAVTKEDIFYYVYGLLHSPEYRERFADNLGKELPRIPRVKSATDFCAFSQAGRKLAGLHLNYESVDPYPLVIESAGKKLVDTDFRVEKMRYGKKGKDKDLTTLHYNDKITLTGIPVEAYDYVVNGKPALDWVVERQRVKTDEDSGIVNDANDWAVETMGNPRYPLELFQRVVTVSLETLKLVRSLPKLKIMSSAD